MCLFWAKAFKKISAPYRPSADWGHLQWVLWHLYIYPTMLNLQILSAYTEGLCINDLSTGGFFSMSRCWYGGTPRDQSPQGYWRTNVMKLSWDQNCQTKLSPNANTSELKNATNRVLELFVMQQKLSSCPSLISVEVGKCNLAVWPKKEKN